MKLDLKEISKTIINLDNATIKDAINSMNNSSLKIVLVINKNKKLAGTIVDGDIRRGLLGGLEIGSSIKSIVQYNPKVVKDGVSFFEAAEIMKVSYFNHLPIVDKNYKLRGLYVLEFMKKPMFRKNQVIIMAGGMGKRLLPLTKTKPKPLIKAFGKPMLEHVILKIKKCGFEKFTLSVNYKKNLIKNYFSDGKNIGVKINYIQEKNFLGTAGSLCYLKGKSNETILVTNCDVVSDIDYGHLLDYHNLNRADATMAVYKRETKNPFGVVKSKENKFISYEEKPKNFDNINAGIYVLNFKILKFLKHEKPEDMPDLFMKLVRAKKKVIVYPIYENWSDLGLKRKK